MASNKASKIIFGGGVLVILAIVIGEVNTPPPPEDPNCSSDLKCFFKRSKLQAEVSCQVTLMDAAKYGYEWAGSSRGRMLSVYDLAAGTILMTGHDVKFETGAGTMVRMEYACIYDVNSEQVTKLTVKPVQ